MSKREKLIKELENNTKNIRFDVIKNLLLTSGYTIQSVKGSHHNFTNGKILITIPYHKPIKPYYVKMVLKAIKEQR
ncbi:MULTISPECIES: type II toxin-antitoxin system HicA family toxin [unclassified Campylobacter]|uniref:type II toxin-antitoxin system HicA family toxin n=1 Tax=unclassified Campylobacter TaxID=2593542 RepID=UPI003D355246